MNLRLLRIDICVLTTINWETKVMGWILQCLHATVPNRRVLFEPQRGAFHAASLVYT